MKMNRNKKLEDVLQMAKAIAEKQGLEIWDVTYVKRGAEWFLSVIIEKANGRVSIDDCERISKELDRKLDDINFSESSYNLEVSSPGVNRELIKEEHIKRYLGENVIIRLIRENKQIASTREFKAKLISFSEKFYEIELENKKITKISKKDIAFIKADDVGGLNYE